MAPPLSLRAAFAHATHFMSQLPQNLAGFSISSPLEIFKAYDVNTSSQSRLTVAPTEFPPSSLASTCPLDGPISCHNETQADSCCFIYPGGRLLLTQFWDEKLHVGGAETDWTLHGLWPDRCDGSYDQYCGMLPRFDNITDVLKSSGHGELDYQPGSEVVDFFMRAFGLFRMLDTYRALEHAGIEPDYRQTYPLSKIQSALEAFSGGRVILQCTGRHQNVLHEAWYVYFVKGSLQSGDFIPAKDSFHGDKGNCAAEVRYLPKRK
ncbi:Ribonuclease T2 precursor (RNase T2) [Diatrype stigma]|uniref:Ribonuclease T2 (RNase T2) n=1 Tax=Diatrype stigma TaxID=117547 RepID=A0AAN9U9V0_9PEZI